MYIMSTWCIGKDEKINSHVWFAVFVLSDRISVWFTWNAVLIKGNFFTMNEFTRNNLLKCFIVFCIWWIYNVLYSSWSWDGMQHISGYILKNVQISPRWRIFDLKLARWGQLGILQQWSKLFYIFNRVPRKWYISVTVMLHHLYPVNFPLLPSLECAYSV